MSSALWDDAVDYKALGFAVVTGLCRAICGRTELILGLGWRLRLAAVICD